MRLSEVVCPVLLVILSISNICSDNPAFFFLFSFFLLKSKLDHVRETHSYFVAKCDAVR